MEALRLDKWLCFARLAKTRSLAQKLIEQGDVVLNHCGVTKSSQQVRPGDEIAIQRGRFDQRVRVLALGERRGPAGEAVCLYEEVKAETV